MFLSLFQSRRAADNSDWHSLIVLHLPWFGSETTSHWGEPKASGAYGAFVLSGLAKIWNWIFIVLMSQQPSNTFRGGSPHSWLVNTCSWHWLIDEPANLKSWHFTKTSSVRGLRKSRTTAKLQQHSSLDKIKQHKESIRAILTFELDKGCGSWRWLLDQDFWSWHCNVALPDIVSLCIRDARQELKWARLLPHVNHGDHV